MGMEFIGAWFVDDEVNNREKIENLLYEKAEELREKAQSEFDEYVKSLGLNWDMGVVYKK